MGGKKGSCRKVVDAKRRRRDIINNRMWSEAELTGIHDITLSSHAMAALSIKLIISPLRGSFNVLTFFRKLRYACIQLLKFSPSRGFSPLHNFSGKPAISIIIPCYTDVMIYRQDARFNSDFLRFYLIGNNIAIAVIWRNS